MQIDLLQIVIQAGAVGIVIYLIYNQRKEREKFLEIISNHINHNTDVLRKLDGTTKENMEVSKELLIFLKTNNGTNNKHKY